LSSLNKPRKPQEKLLFIGYRIAVYKLHLASQPAVGIVETVLDPHPDWQIQRFGHGLIVAF
jgi:hypothetical protein